MTKKAERYFHRSGKKPCQICKAIVPLVKHHINGREIRQSEAAWNICWICPNCHDAVHAGDIIIEQWVSSTDGRMLFWHRKGEDSFVGAEAQVHHYS